MGRCGALAGVGGGRTRGGAEAAARRTWTSASHSRAAARKRFPRPSPRLAPRASPATSTCHHRPERPDMYHYRHVYSVTSFLEGRIAAARGERAHPDSEHGRTRARETNAFATQSIVAGTVRREPASAPSRSPSRASGTAIGATFGSIVQNGKLAACARTFQTRATVPRECGVRTERRSGMCRSRAPFVARLSRACASDWRASALKSVDLPTFGSPTSPTRTFMRTMTRPQRLAMRPRLLESAGRAGGDRSATAVGVREASADRSAIASASHMLVSTQKGSRAGGPTAGVAE